MILAVHQPQYLPWLGYFDKMDAADVFCFLDDVQFKKNEWQNRNRIRKPDGWQWLTVPVLHDFGQLIRDVRTNDKQAWRRKHLAAIRTSYAKAAHYEDVAPLLEHALGREWELLAPLCIRLCTDIASRLGLTTRLVTSSAHDTSDDPTGRLVDLCRALGADTYLSGAHGTDYMELDRFEDAGIDVLVQHYEHPEYEQLHPGFEPFMSVVDLMLNHGERSLDILRGGRRIRGCRTRLKKGEK
ncbi:MAG: WbqC family protein [Desulfatibacillaceae bacterium]